MKRFSLLALLILPVLFGCRKDSVFPNYETEYVIIVVIDGPRYSETWGDAAHTHIPHQSALTSEGVFFNSFWNNGPTYTTSGHTAITTGVSQFIDNNGNELPKHPSIFQVYRQRHNIPQSKTWIVASKDKLEVLANCKDNEWKDKYQPSTNCGNHGLGTGYRLDSLTLIASMEVMNEHHPSLMLINFREPDYSGHQSNLANYIKGIEDTDEYVQQIWDFIQNDPVYKNKTTLFVTNDHGRHLDGVASGFSNHGDHCSGCKKISLLALGPDFTSGKTVSTSYDLTDLCKTVSQLLHISPRKVEGNLIYDLFD